MTDIDPVFTVGEESPGTVERVHARSSPVEGLLDGERRRRPMPALVPLRVGLVTSAGSAAYHDFVQELKASGLRFADRRGDTCHVPGARGPRGGIVFYGLFAQGRAPLDVVVLAPGRRFSTPISRDRSTPNTVAREIAGMPVPVLTGVGHEVDRSVADEVAHTACKTPTACAQILVTQVRVFVENLDHSRPASGVSRSAVACRACRRVSSTTPPGASIGARRRARPP